MIESKNYCHVELNRPLLRCDTEGVPKMVQFVEPHGGDFLVTLFNSKKMLIPFQEIPDHRTWTGRVNLVELHVSIQHRAGYMGAFLGEPGATLTESTNQ